jgi:hypothetical protein
MDWWPIFSCSPVVVVVVVVVVVAHVFEQRLIA